LLVEIDNRLVEHLIGENYDISNFVEGSILYKPSIPLDQVVLPEERKKALIDLINYFPTFLKSKKELDFTSVTEYGDSLVLLFVGPSGTGKTMLANALANHLNKRILIFNLNNPVKHKLL
jgi:SpoVK/Ycf46/Vps4 family AAA+-type ATPase